MNAARGLLGRLFRKNGIGEQLVMWNVMGAVMGALLQPTLIELTKLVNSQEQTAPLSAEQLADMVVRAIVSASEGEGMAKLVGVAPNDFARLVHAAGSGPAIGELVVALRRGLIPESGRGPDAVSFDQGISESRLHNKWGDLMKRLGVEEPTPIEPLEALLEGQLTRAEAERLYVRFGGDLEHFQWRFNARGSAPTPLELSEMANRGIIPWDGEGPDVTSQRQGFLEGPFRDKWWAAYRKLAEYKPPARTITAMVRSGALTHEVALGLFRDLGLSQEMAEAMLRDATHDKLKPTKELALGMVEQLYRDHVISAEDASTFLAKLDYTDQEIGFILTLQDINREVAAVNGAIGRIHTLYVSHKIDRTAAVNSLNSLKVPALQVEHLVATWDIERGANVKVLTAAEIAAAFAYGIIDQPEAMTELAGIGYTPLDAWILLSVRKHEALPDRPAPGPAA